jgi:hypothetical protein
MIRALGKGFMPSNEQVIINLRTVLAADLLNPNNPDLSDSGRLLTRYTKQWLQQFIELLQHKNNEDQIQDFIWFLSKSRISVDVDHLAQRASKAKAKADTAAGKHATVTCPAIGFPFFSDIVPYFGHTANVTQHSLYSICSHIHAFMSWHPYFPMGYTNTF